ncbi:hypothetical protein [Bradyrhizobium sp. S69]|uniref:hypothetical protein n=1 Tax=Bradyrhizobium sp. S69 TaxID=1641856 RepID=UPI00131D9951|nr:hypothetical protein [Bradyrhizobium sp. S69]
MTRDAPIVGAGSASECTATYIAISDDVPDAVMIFAVLLHKARQSGWLTFHAVGD